MNEILIASAGLVIVILVVTSLFVGSHLRPLNNREVKKLATKRKRKRVQDYFSFDTREFRVSKEFKRQMKPDGKLYRMDEGLFQFPSVAAALLKYKKHEWIIVAFEKQKRVRLIWLNKGVDRSGVTLYLPVEHIVDLVRQNQFTSVLISHNHPNPSPSDYDCTNPSQQDMITARVWADAVNRSGANLLEFVCERGRHYRYFASISSNFLPVSDIIAEIQRGNGLSAFSNLSLHLERLF